MGVVAEDRYELLEKIGTGSFATVYRAKDGELGREVAVKQLHQDFLDDPGRLDRYWQEAQLVAQLHHPNIVTIFDIDRGRDIIPNGAGPQDFRLREALEELKRV